VDYGTGGDCGVGEAVERHMDDDVSLQEDNFKYVGRVQWIAW
jgi:hypothetical protein